MHVYCNSNADFTDFYNGIDKTLDNNFSSIENDKLEELKEISSELNIFFNNKYLELIKPGRYIKIMNRIRTNPKMFKATTKEEQYLLFMLSVDPNLEAIIIYNKFNTSKQIKANFEKVFGIYDKNLVKIEKCYKCKPKKR